MHTARRGLVGAGAILADFGANSDGEVRAAGAVLGHLAVDERGWGGVAARAADLLARVAGDGALGAAWRAAAVPACRWRAPAAAAAAAARAKAR